MAADPFETVLGPLMKLRAAVAEEFALRGLRVIEFTVGPGPDVDGPHVVHVLAVRADGEAPPSGGNDGDEAFEEVLRSATLAERERLYEDTRSSLEDRMRDGGLL